MACSATVFSASQVESDYRQRKQQELSEQLTRDLMSRYEVKLLPEQPQDAPGDETPPQDQEDSQ